MSLKCPCFLFAIHSLPLERFYHTTQKNKLQALLSKKFILGYNFKLMFANFSLRPPQAPQETAHGRRGCS